MMVSMRDEPPQTISKVELHQQKIIEIERSDERKTARIGQS